MSEKDSNVEKICKLISEINMTSRINDAPININFNCIDNIIINDKNDENINNLNDENTSNQNNQKENDIQEITSNINIDLSTDNVDYINTEDPYILSEPLSPLTLRTNNNELSNRARIINSRNSVANLNITSSNSDFSSIYPNQNDFTAFYDNDDYSDSLPDTYNSPIDDNKKKIDLKKLFENTKLSLQKNIINKDEKCSICNDSFKEDDICRINNKCNHYYHQTCIDKWYISNTKCPICNQTID